MKGNISIVIALFLITVPFLTITPSSGALSNLNDSEIWSGPGGNSEHNGYFPSFTLNPPLKLVWESKVSFTDASPPLNLALTDNEIVIANNTNQITVYNKSNAKLIRRIETDFFTKNYVSVNKSSVLVGHRKGVKIYDLKKGAIIWESSPQHSELITPSHTPYAVESADGEIIANYGKHFTFIVKNGGIQPINLNDFIVEMPTIGSNKIFVSDNSLMYFDGSFEDAISGDIKIYKANNTQRFPAGPASSTNNTILFASNKSLIKTPIEKTKGSGCVIAIDSRSNNIEWTKWYNESAILSTPSTDGSNVFISCSDGYLRSLNIYNGDLKWEFKTDGSVYCQPIIANGFIFVASTDSYIYGLEADTGKQIWKYKLPSPVISSTLAMDAKNLFVLCKDSKLLCFGQNDDSKPSKIILKSKQDKLRIDKTTELEIKVFNESNIEIPSSKPVLTVIPENFGAIDKNIFYPNNVGKCKIIASIGSLSSEIQLSVYNKSPIFNEIIDFGEVSEGQILKEVIIFKNTTEFPVNIDLKLSKQIGSININEFSINPKSDYFIEYTVDGNSLKSEGLYNFLINVTSEKIEESSIGCVIKKMGFIKPIVETILKIDIDPNGEIKSFQTKITNQNEKYTLSINASTKASWLNIKNANFTIKPMDDFIFDFFVDQKLFRYSEEKKSEIEIKWQKGIVKIQIYAKAIADDKPPNLLIDNLKTYTNAKTAIISGSVDENAILFILDKNNIRKNILTENNRFTIQVNLLPGPSLNKYTLIAKDAVGNETTKIVEIINTGIIIIKLQIGNPIMTVGDKSVAISPAPMVFKGATIIPLRALGEAFGAMVNFQNGEITVTLREKIIKLRINSNEAVVNGVKTQVNPPPVIIQGKTMVPFRFIAEALGAQVFWDQSTKQISIHAEVWPTI